MVIIHEKYCVKSLGIVIQGFWPYIYQRSLLFFPFILK